MKILLIWILVFGWVSFLGFFPDIVFAQDPFDSPIILDADTLETQGVGWADYDNDGWVDLFLSRGNSAGGFSYTNLLFKNNSGVLQKVSLPVLDTVKTSGGVSWADYDNDGYFDLYIAEAQPGYLAHRPRNTLYLNDQAGGFIDKTWDDLVGPIVTDTMDARHVGWGDYNLDGYPDMFVDHGKIGAGPGKEVNYFYKNLGNGTFVRLDTSEIGLIVSDDPAYETFGAGFAWCDYNNDGYPDIFNGSGYLNESRLWKNVNGTKFVSVLDTLFQESGIQSFTMGVSWGDYNNDGKIDLFLSNIIDGFAGGKNYLYKNKSTPTVDDFERLTSGIGPIATDVSSSQGSAWGDYDNDGDLDLYVTNKTEYATGYSYLYENLGATGGYSFNSVTSVVVQLDPGDGSRKGDGRGTAWADVNNDGFLDLAVARLGKPLLFMNKGNGNHFVNITCRGVLPSNSMALGSKVKVVADIPEQNGVTLQVREISAQTGGGSHNSYRAHFGLGTASQIDSLRVEWTSGRVNIYTDLPRDKFMVFKEGDLSVSQSVIPQQNFFYLFGNTGAAVEFTNNTDSDGGSVAVTRFNAEPPNSTFSGDTATAPDGSAVVPNVVSPDRYWSVSESGLTGNFVATIYLDFTGISGISNPDRLVIVRRDNDSSPWIPLNTSRMGNTLYAAGLTVLGEFGIASQSSDNPLPVQLTFFKAISREGMVKLVWQTQSEINNVGFIIERATQNDGDFSEIASYRTNKNLEGQGNSTRPITYEYVDENVTNGVTYHYRLYDVDVNGKRKLLGEVNATPQILAKQFRLFPNYPNPFNPVTHIRFEIPEMPGRRAEISLVVYDNLGRVVRQLHQGPVEAGIHEILWDGTNNNGQLQPSGIYFVRMKGESVDQSYKMILMK